MSENEMTNVVLRGQEVFEPSSGNTVVNQPASLNGNGKHGGTVNRFYANIMLPTVFLFAVLSIILFIPKKLLGYKSQLKDSFSLLRYVVKRVMDVMGAFFGLITSSIIMLFLPLLIKLDSKGPILFKQVRIGRNRRSTDRRVVSLDVPFERRVTDRRQQDLLGKPFKLYKFRSMRADAEKKTGAVWATMNDPRITKVGQVLRPYHIDEIPQLINVLKGEMSLVGPRPERPEFITQFKEEIPNYPSRFTSKPGLTGLAQLNCGYDTSADDVKRKLSFDLRYIRNLRIRNDMKIIWDTVLKICTNYKSKNGKPI